MSPENTKILEERFPRLFRLKNTPDGYRGLECPDGWFDIVNRLCQKIVEHPKGEELAVFQVKEKFGKLRFYLANGSLTFIDGLSQAYDDAHEESGRTCEKCGAQGGVTRMSNFVRKTVCDEHREQYENDIDAYFRR